MSSSSANSSQTSPQPRSNLKPGHERTDIGEGTHGYVVKMIKGGKTWARKTFHEHPLNAFEYELSVYRLLQQFNEEDSPVNILGNVPKLIGASTDPKERCKHIDMEFIEGKTLGDLVETTTVEEINQWEEAAVHLLGCLHEIGIAHDDINGSNIMLRPQTACKDLYARMVILDFADATLRTADDDDDPWEAYKRADLAQLECVFDGLRSFAVRHWSDSED